VNSQHRLTSSTILDQATSSQNKRYELKHMLHLHIRIVLDAPSPMEPLQISAHILYF